MKSTLRFLCVLSAIHGVFAAESSHAAVIAFEGFDGSPVALASSNVPTLDGGGGDSHAVGATSAWPTTGGTPFGLADNSLGAVGDTSAFLTDTEGVFGVNSDFNNNFLGISDTRVGGDFDGNPVVSTWNFTIGSATDLSFFVAMGSMESSTFGYGADTSFVWSYAFDGGPSMTALTVAPDAAGLGYQFRALDSGTVVTAAVNALSVTGPAAVSKFLAEDGTVSMNTFLDKTPAIGPNAGQLDVFGTTLVGTGNVLTLTLTSSIAFEAIAIDNIRIEGTAVAIPEPSSVAILAVSGLAASLFHRRRKKAA